MHIPLNLQLFAEPGEGDPNKGSETPPSFDDFLKDKTAQSEFDKRVAKALETAKGKWDREASLTADEKAAAKTKEREDAIAKREGDIIKRELRAKALDTLGQKGLPTELADTLSYADEDGLNASLTSVEKAFRASLSKAVDEKLKGSPPPAGDGKAPSQMAAMRAAVGLPATK